MSSVVLSGDTSGTITITAPAVAGSNTATLPAGTGTIAVQGASTNIVVGTSVATTSGTSVDITGIPSWVKRVTLMLNGVSTNGSSTLLIQIGTSSGVETSGYASGGTYQGASEAGATSTAGFLNGNGGTSADATCGLTTFCSFGSNKWVSSSVSATTTTNYTYIGGGAKTLSGTLDRVRITTVNGTDQFDAGSINILYE